MPEENLTCTEQKDLKSPLMCLNQARYGIAWGVVGSMMAFMIQRLIMLNQEFSFLNQLPHIS